MRRWQLRKEAPVLQRHSVILTARHQQEETAAVWRPLGLQVPAAPEQSSRLALRLPQAAYTFP